MHSYSYRSVKAIAEHRYPQLRKNRYELGPVVSEKIWRDVIAQDPDRSKRKQRANNRAPNGSRAA